MHARTLLSLIPACVALASAAPAAALDTELYARLLAEHTYAVSDTAGTRVDYASLKRSSAWRRLVASLADVHPSRTGRDMAFWINAYNVLAIDLVVQDYPVDSIRDIGSIFQAAWDHEAGSIGGTPHTLGEIEHEILRPLGDPRIHAAIVCASTSCPSLHREPYTQESLDAQLDKAVRSFLENTEKGLHIDPERKRVKLSRIFDWFADDFGGSAAVTDFAARYSPPPARRWILENRSGVTIEYFTYDWSLNDLEVPNAR